MRYVLGFDGGGTKTECVLMDETRAILARTRSGPSNPLRAGFPAAVAALRQAAHDALAEARIEHLSIVAVCAGLAGTGQPEAAQKMHEELSASFPRMPKCASSRTWRSRWKQRERPAVVLVAGTGSAAVGPGSQGTCRASVATVRCSVIKAAPTTSGAERRHFRECATVDQRELVPLDANPAPASTVSWAELQEPYAATAADEVFPSVFPVVACAASRRRIRARASHRRCADLADLLEMILSNACSFAIIAFPSGQNRRHTLAARPVSRRPTRRLLEACAPKAKIGPLPIAPAEAAAHRARLLSTPRWRKSIAGRTTDRERALTATGDELAALFHHHAADVLLALLDNPALDETQLCLLLARKDLPAEILEEVARRKPLLKNYRVKRALAFHPRAPRLATSAAHSRAVLDGLGATRVLPGTPTELKRNAEDQLTARLPQLPLGQKYRWRGVDLRASPARCLPKATRKSFPSCWTIHFSPKHKS